jgi:hypothetical protein
MDTNMGKDDWGGKPKVVMCNEQDLGGEAGNS